MSLESFDPFAVSKNLSQSPTKEDTLNIGMLENPVSIISTMKKGRLRQSNEGIDEFTGADDDDSHLNSVENIFKPSNSSKSVAIMRICIEM